MANVDQAHIEDLEQAQVDAMRLYLNSVNETFGRYARTLIDAGFPTPDTLGNVGKAHVPDMPIGVVLRIQECSADQFGVRKTGGLSVTLKRARVTKELRFARVPTWEQLWKAVEESFPEFQEEDFQLMDGKAALNEDTWLQSVGSSRDITLQVVSSALALCSYSEGDVHRLLGTKIMDQDDDAFPLAAYDENAQLPPGLAAALGISRHGELLDLVGKDLALRAYTDESITHNRTSRRELISPVLFAAAALSGETQVAALYSTTGTVAKGSIDYVLTSYWFSIVVVEGKLDKQLFEHSGQLAAAMRSTREQFSRTMLGKRKHEPEEDFRQVPSIGILSTGTQYIFHRYDLADEQYKQITRSSSMVVHLVPGITAKQAAIAALPVIRRLVQVIEDQKQIMRKLTNLPDAVKHWKVGPADTPELPAPRQ